MVDGGGVKNRMEGIVVGMLKAGKEGIVVGMVGSDAGRGNVTLGIVVGIVGRDGNVGREVVGIGGNAAFGTVGRFGMVGIAGSGGNATLGRFGMVGNVGWEDCIKWRAAKLTSMHETDNARTKARRRLWLKAAIYDLVSKRSYYLTFLIFGGVEMLYFAVEQYIIGMAIYIS